ncbi:DNA polymerase III subunit gamma/tau [Balneolaceae bacterium YR4-1]|uniref:DNA polymerase III subunit gamma/tau n=1 Tax=Halalkalibaculum roseum TaxID=2709311 RepID=A0A6M1SW32_9BACT|nr:DNA polymerase III subunit gamma/tau [Halalkalibaculum roseum]NGP75194.1 DNA polymerase III subunit gamma/tau [Halalkalibaculum roseum]
MSDNYRALTRTYRPRTFDDIVSQHHVSDTLKNAIKQNRLAHAYMFCGPRGVGKTTMARVLARTVNSIEDEVDGESLNQTLNVIEIDAASNNGVDDIRDLRERVRIPPQNGRYKIYIIDEVHMLSKAAFNALLKTLEEPPDHVIFIFATTEPHKVLPTILSRVQRFDFKRISIDEIVSRLETVAQNEGIQIDHESLHVIAKKADGALRDALGLMDQAIAFCGTDIEHDELLRALNVVSKERMFQFMDAVESQNSATGLELINELLQEGYDIQEFLIGLTEHIRNLYVAKNSEKMHLVEASKDTKERYKTASNDFSDDDLMRMLHIVNEAQYKIKEAHQPKILFEITLLKLIHMERTRNLNALISDLNDLKKKLSNGQLVKTTESGSTNSSNSTESPQKEQQSSAKEPLPTDDAYSQTEQSVPNPKNTGESPVEKTQAGQNGQAEPLSNDDDGNNSKNGVSEPKHPAANNPNSNTGSAERPASDYQNFFGEPSLGNCKNKEPSVNGTENKPQQSSAEEPEVAVQEPPKNVSLNEVKEAWPAYVETLRSKVQQMLYFQMQRMDPVSLKNRELTLRCSDDFAKKILEENKKRLAKVLEEEVGVFLRLKCIVQKTEKDTEESMSPYERFKALQERDPKIKKLVELFGAELDYNLNQ